MLQRANWIPLLSMMLEIYTFMGSMLILPVESFHQAKYVTKQKKSNHNNNNKTTPTKKVKRFIYEHITDNHRIHHVYIWQTSFGLGFFSDSEALLEPNSASDTRQSLRVSGV